MAIKTLKGVKKIDGFNVLEMDTIRNEHPEMFRNDGSMKYDEFEKLRAKNPIQIRHDVNSISFTIQNGAIKENGVNGCQVTSMIAAAKMVIEGLNENFPCDENRETIRCLDEALSWQIARTKDREKRGVEGHEKK